MSTQNKKTILFLLPYPLDEAPSQRFRFEQYFDILKANGFDYKISSFFNLKAWFFLYVSGKYLQKICFVFAGFGKRIFDIFRSYPFDYIFIHREAAPIGPPIFEWILSKILRKKIIYDFDDSIWLPNTSNENKLAANFKCNWKVKYICEYAYIISVGNNYLANYARNFNSNVVINPTTLKNINKTKPITQSQNITIGWTGTHSTMPFLNSIEPVISELSKEYDITFLIISNQNPTNIKIPFTYIKWNKKNEIVDLLKFDIGIMPLPNDEWAKGKCGFKALQYMALGIPVIASNVGANSEIITHNANGYLAENQLDWYNYLKILINDYNLRNTIGINGQKTVLEKYSTSSNTPNFLSLFQ